MNYPEVGTNLPEHKIVELLKGMLELKMEGEIYFLTQQSYLSGSIVEQQLKRMKQVLHRKLEKKPLITFCKIYYHTSKSR